jgi:hypothetical protein
MALIFLTMSAKHDGQIPWLVSPGTSPSLCFQRHAPLTPGPCDQVIALTQRGAVLSVCSALFLQFSVLPPKSRQMRCDPLVSLLQHIGPRSSTKVRAGGQPLKKHPSP